MTATFPGGVKAFTTKNAGDEVDESHVNDLQDEVAAVETGVIGGHARGGPLDKYMTADPGFNLEVNNGLSYVTYDAVNDRYEVAIVGDGAVTERAVYLTLPTPLQVTPSPSSIIELTVELTIQAVSISSEVMARIGLMNAAGLGFFGVSVFSDGTNAIESILSGSTGGKKIAQTGATTGTRYQVKMRWQVDGALALDSKEVNASTGATIDDWATTPVTTATHKDLQLPHLGIKFSGDTGDSMTIYIYDIFARVLRS